MKDHPCFLGITGFGLQKGDSILLTKGQCGDSESSVAHHGEVNQEGHTNVIVAYDDSGRAVIRNSGFTVYKVPEEVFRNDNSSFEICYAPKLGVRSHPEKLDPADYFHHAGTLFVADHVYTCDFEGGKFDDCGFTPFIDHYDMEFSWKVLAGPGPKPATGPKADHTKPDSKDGHYAIMQSPPYLNGASAVIMGPPIGLSSGGYCFQFAYNMHGTDVNSLRIYLNPINQGQNLENTFGGTTGNRGSWGSPKWVAVGDKGDDWYLGGFAIDLGEPLVAQIVFEGIAGKSEIADIAIDDIKITRGECPSETRVMPNSRVGSKEMICGEVRMITGEHPEDKAWNLDGAISCAGKGYSRAQVEHAWVPCCVPHFGQYTLLLHDRMNDGWEGSKLEMRFFDKVSTFGDEMKKRTGDLKVSVVIGLVEIVDAEYADEEISIKARVVHPDMDLWCGIAPVGGDGEVRQPSPVPQLIKDYGVHAGKPSSESGEVVTLKIQNPKEGRKFVQPGVEYDIYCYVEPSYLGARQSINENLDQKLMMNSKQIAATRFRITADRVAPKLRAHDVQVQLNKIMFDVESTKPGKGWCVARIIGSNNGPITIDGVKATGKEVTFKKDSLKQSIEIANLASDSRYEIFCVSQDNCKPRPNLTTQPELEKGGIVLGESEDPVRFQTRKRVPNVRIVKVVAISKGFDVNVKIDAPGKVWCAAAPESVEFPSSKSVREAGSIGELSQEAFAENSDTILTVAIRGVESQTRYKVHCTTSTWDGDLTMVDKEMWKAAYQVMSYGKFCDIPAMPPITERDEVATPFDPLSPDEEMKVRRFMLAQKELGFEGLYRVTLFPNKTEIYAYYDDNGPLPKRYARVRAGRCLENRGFYEQMRVGPLDESEDKMKWHRLAKPYETNCEGYLPEGVFGRRRLDSDDDFEKFQKILKESFDYEFNNRSCIFGDSSCLRLGAIAIETHAADTSIPLPAKDGVVWVGLKRPDGSPVPFFFGIRPEKLKLGKLDLVNMHGISRMLDSMDWFSTPDKFWYNGGCFGSLAELVRAYETGKVQKADMSSITEKRRLIAVKDQAERYRKAVKRRLDPGPFPGAAGTAGLDLDRARKRTGLEFRIPPEQVEPEGKRFTVKSHPGGGSFTIDYQGWSFVVTNDRDKALQMWNLRFQGETIAFQFGLQEALAHYTVSERTFFFMDSWYGGLGGAARPILRGYECPKHGAMAFWDHSLCIWEQDMARPIRSHYRAGEIRDAAGHYSLHVRQMITVSNYDYISTYIFHSSGHVEMKVEFTGELYAGVEVPWWSSRQSHYGTQVTGAMRFAALHAHAVNWRIDFDLGDYKDNSILFEEVVPDPARVGANYLVRRFPEREKDAVIGVNATRAIAYEIVDEARDTYGNYGGWRIMPGKSWSPNAPNFELYSGPAAWAKYQVFSTKFKYSELDATLPRDNKYAGDSAVSVDRYIGDNDEIRHTDVVTWTSMGFIHIPCAEDYPLTVPVGNTLSAMFRPNNWFLEDPTMDLHNAVGGEFSDLGQCAVVRRSLDDAMDMNHARGPVIL